MSDTPETDHLEDQLGSAARLSHPIIWKHARQLERERDEAREALADWDNAAAHVEADHPDEKHCGCVPVLRKLLTDALKDRDEWAAMCGRYKQERDVIQEKYRFAVIHWQIGVAKMERERDEAREELIHLRSCVHDVIHSLKSGAFDELEKAWKEGLK